MSNFNDLASLPGSQPFAAPAARSGATLISLSYFSWFVIFQISCYIKPASRRLFQLGDRGKACSGLNTVQVFGLNHEQFHPFEPFRQTLNDVQS